MNTQSVHNRNGLSSCRVFVNASQWGSVSLTCLQHACKCRRVKPAKTCAEQLRRCNLLGGRGSFKWGQGKDEHCAVQPCRNNKTYEIELLQTAAGNGSLVRTCWWLGTACRLCPVTSEARSCKRSHVGLGQPHFWHEPLTLNSCKRYLFGCVT